MPVPGASQSKNILIQILILIEKRIRHKLYVKYCKAESAFLFRDSDRLVTIPSLTALKRRILKALGRLKTLKAAGRFRTPRDGVQKNKNADSAV